jgi:AGZA family xanthine/uracil permease-like MFS transporter
LLVFKNGMSAAGGYFGAAEFSAFAPEWRVGGLVALDRGFILSSMGLAALCVMTIERRLAAAAGWAWAMAALSLFGVIHAWNPLALGDSATIGWATGWRFAIAYGIWGAILFALRRRVKADRRAGEEIRSTSTT